MSKLDEIQIFFIVLKETDGSDNLTWGEGDGKEEAEGLIRENVKILAHVTNKVPSSIWTLLKTVESLSTGVEVSNFISGIFRLGCEALAANRLE